MQIIRGAALATVPWRNGLGTSRIIAGAVGEHGELAWQVGIADLAGDAAFSHYPYCDRIFTPIVGESLPALSFDGGPFEPCPSLVPKPFAGDRQTVMRLAAPGRAFNLFVDRRHYRGEVVVHSLAPGETMAAPAADVTLIHCLAGSLASSDVEVRPSDSILGPDSVEAVLPGTMLIVVRIDQR